MFRGIPLFLILVFVATSCFEKAPTGSDKRNSSDAVTYDELLNPPKMKECNGKGLLYDRTKDTCRANMKLADYKCNPANATTEFKKHTDGVVLRFSTLLAMNWKFDQCAVSNGKPVAIMVRQKPKAKEPELEVMELKLDQ